VRAYIHGVPIPGLFGWPEGETFVVFRGQNDVFCACIFKKACPLVWLKEFRFEVLGEILVFYIWAKSFVVEIRKKVLRFTWILPTFPIPFGITLINPCLLYTSDAADE
jgi:hypothetical protein